VNGSIRMSPPGTGERANGTRVLPVRTISMRGGDGRGTKRAREGRKEDGKDGKVGKEGKDGNAN
jgi:hypothetical protein